MEAALEALHIAEPTVSVAVEVHRHPFSFDVEAPDDGVLGEWAQVLKESARHEDGTHTRLNHQAAAASLKFRYEVAFGYHPVDSQRLLLWAARQGKQEALAEELSTRHFEHAESVHERATLVAAARAVGLDANATEQMLRGDELRDEVWSSYQKLSDMGVTAIPLFVLTQKLRVHPSALPPPTGGESMPTEAAEVVKPYVFSGSGPSRLPFRCVLCNCLKHRNSKLERPACAGNQKTFAKIFDTIVADRRAADRTFTDSAQSAL
eukprot:SAG11_NODE_5591_length_1515_cov_1.557203_1_plen_264_part_00